MTQPSPFPAQFDGKSADYLRWRDDRLTRQAKARRAPVLLSPAPDTAENEPKQRQICSDVKDHGFALYEWNEPSDNPSQDLTALHADLSLQSYDSGVVHDDNGLSLLTDLTGTDQGRFIPYTSRAMGWHTDGYYNTTEQSLGSFTLHCINPAQSGGTLTLLDQQLVLIALYDNNPELVALLSHPQAMTLPANTDNLGHDRPDRHSPVLFMRTDGTPGAHFTTRTRNIEWRTPDTLAAANTMKTLIDEHSNWHFSIRLRSGQGVITRNVLHRREAYTDSPESPRKMLRGRYLQSPQCAQATNETPGS
jgi:hypothetical protein